MYMYNANKRVTDQISHNSDSFDKDQLVVVMKIMKYFYLFTWQATDHFQAVVSYPQGTYYLLLEATHLQEQGLLDTL